MQILTIPTAEIAFFNDNINILNPNKYIMLVESIKKEGVIEPLVVIHHADPKNEKKYLVINGNHRLMACMDLNISTVPCVVKDTEEAEALKLCVHMNQFRGETNVEKLISVISVRLEALEPIEKIAEELNMTPSWVAQHYNMRGCKIAVSDNLNTDTVCVPAFIPTKYHMEAIEIAEAKLEKRGHRKTLSIIDIGMVYGNMLMEIMEKGVQNLDFYVTTAKTAIKEMGFITTEDMKEMRKKYTSMEGRVNSLMKTYNILREDTINVLTKSLKIEDEDFTNILLDIRAGDITPAEANRQIKNLMLKRLKKIANEKYENIFEESFEKKEE